MEVDDKSITWQWSREDGVVGVGDLGQHGRLPAHPAHIVHFIIIIIIITMLTMSKIFFFFFLPQGLVSLSTLRFSSLLHNYLGRFRIQTQDLCPEVWCATNEPPHLQCRRLEQAFGDHLTARLNVQYGAMCTYRRGDHLTARLNVVCTYRRGDHLTARLNVWCNVHL